mgnify:FL=1|tara:strand:- start:175 stop:1161 length:987 start_codon:yes stop_codon:yes gene_type:complete
MNEISFQHINSNGINLRLAIAGEGPLIIFCHGWPESWYSYRHQLPSIAEAGYKAVTYDVRGYGESDKPHPIESYTMRELTADVIGILDALGYEEAITIGHDWGGPIALNTAALYPERIKATGSLSVPYMGGRGPLPLLDIWKEIYKGKFFYQLYFQKEGVAEKEFEDDLKKALTLTYTNSDGRGMAAAIKRGESGLNPPKTPESTFLEGMQEFSDLPSWLSSEDIDYFVSQFEIGGMRGPLNRYRAQNIDWQELENLPEKLDQPAFFVTGSLDPVNFFVPSNKSLLERIEVNYENLLITKEIQDIGHWTQQESPDEVNRVILEFLNKI